jgi:carbonic anhydrase
MTIPKRLLDGYRSFQRNGLPAERSRYQALAATGQRPETMVIGCCDSRVAPEAVFDAHPGELFVVRNVSNLVPPYAPTGLTHGVSAALEFAVQLLKVKHIVVLGHTQCGGIRAFVEHRDRPTPGDFIDSWMSLVTPAAKVCGIADHAEDLTPLERASIAVTLDNLMTFPWIRQAVERTELQLIGAHFDIGSGSLSVYEPGSREFLPVEADV